MNESTPQSLKKYFGYLPEQNAEQFLAEIRELSEEEKADLLRQIEALEPEAGRAPKSEGQAGDKAERGPFTERR